MTDAELIARLRLYGSKFHHEFGHNDDAADRIEALTEQLEAARADAKEAEAYAGELEKEIELNEQEACMLEDDFIKADKQIDALKAKLARAVEALRLIGADENENWQANTARTTLAEIEGEKG
jgi:hypothetical protein